MARVGIVIVSVATLALGCQSSNETEATVGPSPATRVDSSAEQNMQLQTGFAVSQRSYEGKHFPEFLELVEGNADVLLHAGDWAELASPTSPFQVIAALAALQDQHVAIVLSPSSGPDMLRELTESTKTAYLGTLRAFLETHQPRYLGLANEVNMLAVQDPAGFAAVVELWDAALPIVRQLAPETQAFVTFQYERTVGRHDGWFGGRVVDEDWSVLDRFAGMELAAFTT